MKKTQLIYNIMLAVCLALGACQNLDDPYNPAPEVITPDLLEVRAREAYIQKEGSGYRRARMECSSNQEFTDTLAVTETHFGTKQCYLASGLQSNTTYYYRLCVTDGISEAYGEVKSFTTLSNLRISQVTFTDWDGTQKDFASVYDSFGATITSGTNGQTVHNLSVTRTDNTWILPQEFQAGNGNYVVRAYTPYTATGYDNGNIPVQTYKYDGTCNYLSATAESDPEGSSVNLHFRHVMARVILHFSVSDENTQDETKISRFTVGNGQILPTSGQLLLFENGIVFGEPQTLPLAWEQPFGLQKGQTTDITLYSIPTTASGHVVLTLYTDNGTHVSTELEADWKEGSTHEYTIAYKNAGLIVTDVRVTEWQNQPGGDIPVIDNN